MKQAGVRLKQKHTNPCSISPFLPLLALFPLGAHFLSLLRVPEICGKDAGERGVSGAGATPRTLRGHSVGGSPRGRPRAGIGGSLEVGPVGLSAASGNGDQ